MKGIFTAAGTLISFGTEITTPSLIRSQSFFSIRLAGGQVGRRVGVGGERAAVLPLSPAHRPLGSPRLLLSHGAAHSRPKQGTFTKVKSSTRVLQRRTLTRHGRQE